MRAYILGDLQAHAWGQSVTQEGVNERLMDVVRQLRRTRKKAIKNKIKYIFILGDVFEERGKLDIVVLNMIHREIAACSAQGIEVIIVLGNHDKIDVGDFHSLEVFRNIASIVDKPRLVKADGAKVLVIPFMAEPKKIVKVLKRKGKKADLILMHTSVLNVKLDSGAKWTEGIPLKSIPKKPWTFIGHDHTHKKLRKRVYHVGSLLHVDAGDRGKEKVFAEIHVSRDKEGKKQTQVRWHKTKGPEFVEFKMQYQEKKWKKTLKSIRDRCEGNFVKLHYDGPLNMIGKIKRYLERKLHVRSADILPVVTASADESLKISTTKRLRTMLKEYAKKHVPEADRDSVVSICNAVIKEALTHESKA